MPVDASQIAQPSPLTTGASPKMLALQQLSNQLPIANARVAQQQQASRDLQLQQAVAAAPAKAPVAEAAQQAGGIQAQNAGQQMVQTAQQNVQQQQNLGQAGLTEQGNEQKLALGSQQLGANESAQANVQKLAQLNSTAKQEMYDAKMQFQTNQAGQVVLNQRQLDDFAALQAKNSQDWQSYQDQVSDVTKMKSQLLTQSYAVLSQQLQSNDQQMNQLKDEASSASNTQAQQQNARNLLQQKDAQGQQIQQQLDALQISIAQQQADAANQKLRSAAIGSVIGATAGGTAGAVFGGPVGAAAGASAGQSLGGGVGAATATT